MQNPIGKIRDVMKFIKYMCYVCSTAAALWMKTIYLNQEILNFYECHFNRDIINLSGYVNSHLTVQVSCYS